MIVIFDFMLWISYSYAIYIGIHVYKDITIELDISYTYTYIHADIYMHYTHIRTISPWIQPCPFRNRDWGMMTRGLAVASQTVAMNP